MPKQCCWRGRQQRQILLLARTPTAADTAVGEDANSGRYSVGEDANSGRYLKPSENAFVDILANKFPLDWAFVFYKPRIAEQGTNQLTN